MRFSQIGSISDAVEYTAEQRKETSKTFSSKKDAEQGFLELLEQSMMALDKKCSL